MTNTVKSNPDSRSIVVIFDVCSSTKIFEDLNRSENLHEWAKLLQDLAGFLIRQQLVIQFQVHKFLGDGWILFFDPLLQHADLIPFLHRLSDEYIRAFKKRIRNLLATRINPGLTFGVDRGTLIWLFELNGQEEYTGRAITIAARLQGAIKDGDPKPQGKVLMSKPAYEHLRPGIPKNYRVVRVNRGLHNVAGGEEYEAIKLYLYDEPSEAGSVDPSEPPLSVGSDH